MKNLIFLLVVLLLSNKFVFSQGDPPADQQVIFLGIFGLNPNDTRNFTTTAQGTVWGNYPSDPFSISEDEAAYQSSYQQTGNSNSDWTSWGGWDIVTHSTIPEVVGFGFYKITTDDSPSYFYYNNRDCHYSFACGNRPPNYNPDAPFKYLANENVFQYRIRGQSEYIDITNGQLINSWDMLNYGTLPSSYGFEDFWDNALVVVNDAENHPLLVWGPYPNPGILTGPIVYYKIYYNQHTHGNPPGTFTLLGTVQDDVYMYEDIGATVGNGELDRSYYVKAVFNDGEESLQETEPTNTVTIQLSQNQQKILLSKDIKIDKDILLQNYPNPFNPTTNIKYQISDYGFVTLKVYDVLGKEVATLINEQKQAGNHSVEFDGSNLPSGIYFYDLTSGEFTSTKKLILMK